MRVRAQQQQLRVVAQQRVQMGVAVTVALYGCFLGACGYYGAWSRDFEPKAMHSLTMGGGVCAAMWECALCTSRGDKAPYVA